MFVIVFCYRLTLEFGQFNQNVTIQCKQEQKIHVYSILLINKMSLFLTFDQF